MGDHAVVLIDGTRFGGFRGIRGRNFLRTRGFDRFSLRFVPFDEDGQERDRRSGSGRFRLGIGLRLFAGSPGPDGFGFDDGRGGNFGNAPLIVVRGRGIGFGRFGRATAGLFGRCGSFGCSGRGFFRSGNSRLSARNGPDGGGAFFSRRFRFGARNAGATDARAGRGGLRLGGNRRRRGSIRRSGRIRRGLDGSPTGLFGRCPDFRGRRGVRSRRRLDVAFRGGAAGGCTGGAFTGRFDLLFRIILFLGHTILKKK